MPLIAYDWRLPYRVGQSRAKSLTLERAVSLARFQGVPILFDDSSQTPFFTYNENLTGIPKEHIVWFIDARSVEALLQIVVQRNLEGSGVWNIIVYYPQLWLITNVQYDIKRIP
jgi:spore germination protein